MMFLYFILILNWKGAIKFASKNWREITKEIQIIGYGERITRAYLKYPKCEFKQTEKFTAYVRWERTAKREKRYLQWTIKETQDSGNMIDIINLIRFVRIDTIKIIPGKGLI